MVERGYIVTTTKSTRGTDQKNGQLKTKTYHVNDAVGGVVIGAIGADAASGAAGREGETAPDTDIRPAAGGLHTAAVLGRVLQALPSSSDSSLINDGAVGGVWQSDVVLRSLSASVSRSKYQ